MKRRELVLAVLACAGLGPLRAGAQPARKVAMLLPFTEEDRQAQLQAHTFRDELRRAGWEQGRNLTMDVRWAGANAERIRAHARDLVASAPDVIIARTTPVTRALLEMTRSIPVVFVVVSDPLGDGFVSSLARPGGNVTGFTNVESSLGGKWLELLKLVNRDVGTVGVLYGPKTAPGGGTYYIPLLEQAGAATGAKIIPLPVDQPADVEAAIAQLARQRNAGLIVTPDVTTANNRALIILLAAKHRLPAVYSASYFSDDGGLISYGIDYVDLYRRAAGYADRVLRGARVGELPVQGPTKFDLTINLRSAKAIGVQLPDSLLVRADRVIGR